MSLRGPALPAVTGGSTPSPAHLSTQDRVVSMGAVSGSVEKPQDYQSIGYKGLDPASVFISWMTPGNLLPLSEAHLPFCKMETDNTVLQGEDLEIGRASCRERV